ncbi:hypothetical protein [Lagierella sp.]|uniref:hypothetical protein n=1 Tax=Lagierella sp. TaxID=2849657 RepID=UPI00260C57C1|nr:hypothetical protein [Lagierella sp.]
MDIFKDFFHIQQKALKRTFKNPRYIIIVSAIIIAGIISTNILSNILFGIVKGGGYFSGLLIYILRVFIIGFLMSILYRAVKDSKSKTLYQNYDFSQFAIKILQIGFILYLVNFLLRTVNGNLYRIIYLISLLVFNALPETIYLEEYDGFNSIVYSVDFFKNNLVNWGLSNIIISLIFYYVMRGQNLLAILNLKDIKGILVSVLIVLLAGIYMIYRGVLFDELNGSSRRKREFMRNFNNE